jgi:hypothetical protein
MRLKEFAINEATINLPNFKTRNAHYWRNFLKMVKDNRPIQLGASGSETVYVEDPDKVHQMLSSIWDGSDVATSEQLNSLKKVQIPTTDGKPFKVTSIFKSQSIKGGSKFWNLGNIVEGVMGAAVTAKFISPDADVSEKDIASILKKLKPGTPAPTKRKSRDPLVPYSYSTNIKNDKLTFTLSLNSNDFNALITSVTDPTALKEYPNNEEIFKAFKDAANYVNTASTVKTAIARVQEDSSDNEVLIESEGGNAEKQTSTKADLFITIDGVTERLLSLKSKTVPQIGQVSGHAFENVQSYFKSIVDINIPNNFKQKFPVGNFRTVGQEIFENAFPEVYQHVFKVLSGELQGDVDQAEYDLIKTVYNGIVHHATLGEDVTVVYLSPSVKKAYTELRFGKNLLDSLADFDLEPFLAGPTRLKIIGYPVTEQGKLKSNGKPLDLLQMRSYVSAGSTVRNIIEVGPLLKILADVDQSKFKSPSMPLPSTEPTRAANKSANITDKRQF